MSSDIHTSKIDMHHLTVNSLHGIKQYNVSHSYKPGNRQRDQNTHTKTSPEITDSHLVAIYTLW